MRVLIVAPNISMRMGGEAVLPFHYIRELRALGAEVYALTHARVRDELLGSEIWENGSIYFVEDSGTERALFAAARWAPPAIADSLFNTAIGAVTLRRLAARARVLARDLKVDVVHQPAPVSPKFPSFLTGLPAPLVVGPLNGGISFPPAFRKEFSKGSQMTANAARAVSGLANTLAPGKRAAACVLVANTRTRGALPSGIPPGRTELLAENGVDLSLWSPGEIPRAETPTFVFVGRLVWWKGVELLIEAFSDVKPPARLVVIGDGEERARLEELARGTRRKDKRIEFLGFRPQPEIRDVLTASTALVLPSLRESGGAVILEAFACRTPAIATAWGGPLDYVTQGTGILVSPESRAQFVAGLAAAMNELAGDPGRVQQMGDAARRRIEENFSWRAKAERMLTIYERVLEAPK